MIILYCVHLPLSGMLSPEERFYGISAYVYRCQMHPDDVEDQNVEGMAAADPLCINPSPERRENATQLSSMTALSLFKHFSLSRFSHHTSSPLSPLFQLEYIYRLTPTRLRNSLRVLDLRSKHPRTQEVMVDAVVFWTPRMDMHRCDASMTTATPWGLRISMMACATSLVRRSWTWRRREYISAMRGNLERPMTVSEGM